MSVLDTVFVMFKADSKDLKKGYAEVNKSTDKLVSGLKGKIAGLLGGAAIISGMRAAEEYADRLGKISDAIGVNIEDVDAWGGAVARAGGSAESFQSSIKVMTGNLADFAAKGTSRVAPFFDQLGIAMVDSNGKARNFIDILPELADAFSKISKSESFGIGQKMGLDSGTIMLLQQGRKSVQGLIKDQKELGVVSKEDAQISAKFSDTWADLKQIFRSLFVEINHYLLPIITAILKPLIDFGKILVKNKKIMLSVIIAAAAIFAAFFPVVSIIVAAAAAFGLLYDDIQAFNNGQKSFIGYVMNHYPKLTAYVKALVFPFTLLNDAIRSVVEIMLNGFDSAGESTNRFGQLMFAVATMVINIWNSLSSTINDTVNSISDGVNKVSAVINKAKSFVGLGGGDGVVDAADAINSANSSPINGLSSAALANSSSSVNKNTSVSTGDITIQTSATDADGIADSLAKSIQDHFTNTINDSDDGVFA